MAGDDQERAALARAIRDHLAWDRGDLLGLPELEPAALRDLAGGAANSPAPLPAPVEPPTSASSPDAPVQPLPALSGPPAAPPASSQGTAPAPAEVAARLEVLQAQVGQCTKCELHQARTKTVFARGNPAADLVFVGEGPGREEDLSGLPFVGAAGKLLDKMIAAMGRSEDDVYICNVVKCRPPQNRTPLPREAGACAPYLEGQIDAIAPRIIVALGRCAAENLGCVPPSGGRWRGRWGSYRDVPVMPTYHPAFLLRSPEFKRPVWEDLQQVMKRLGR